MGIVKSSIEKQRDADISDRRSRLLRGVCLPFMAVAAGLGGASSHVLAQDAAEANEAYAGIEEIIVTARKRAESLQDTPIAITALTGEAMAQRNLTNLSQVGSFAPNVTMNAAPGGSGGANNIQVYIRGVGQSDFLFTTDPGIGIYIDGVYHPRTLGGVLDLLDLERVEILRGPQGTLFGKNTIGGAISVTSKKPSGDTGGYVDATIGSFNRVDVRGSFEFPLSDTFSAKFSASSKNRDGYSKRLDFESGEVIGTTGSEDQQAMRAAFRWTPSDRTSVDIVADYSRWRQQAPPSKLLVFDESQSVVAFLWNIFVADPYPISEDFITDDPYTSYSTGPNSNTLDAWGISANIEQELSANLTLKSVTAYRNMEATFGLEGDGSPLTYVETNDVQDQNQFSQELQLIGSSLDDKLSWVVGAFYFDEFGRDQNQVRLGSGFFEAFESLPGPIDGSPLATPTAPGGPGNPINAALDLDFDIFNEIDITSYAFFGQGTYDLSEKLSFTAGGRYSHEKKDYFLDHQKIASGQPIYTGNPVNSWNSFTFVGSLDYRWNEQALTYASVSRGFKSGGFNGRPINEGSVGSFDPEKVTAYEVGLKSDWLGRRVRLNLAAFYNDYADIQLTVVSADEFGILQLRVDNAGNAHVKGFEFELQAEPTERVQIDFSLGHTDFNLVSLRPGVSDITLDTVWPKTPKWTASGGLQYTAPIGDDASAMLRIDWLYTSGMYIEPTNHPSLYQKGHGEINARLVYQNHENAWEAAIFVTNLTDNTILATGGSNLTSFGTIVGTYARPREWGVTVKKTF